jgi:hypothetical protein
MASKNRRLDCSIMPIMPIIAIANFPLIITNEDESVNMVEFQASLAY